MDHILRKFYVEQRYSRRKHSLRNSLESAVSYTGDVGKWVEWFLEILIRAVNASEEKLEAAKQKAVLFAQWTKKGLSERQASILSRLVDGFEGKLTTEKWSKLCKCSHDTALRDIDDLIDKGIMQRSAEGGRSTSYSLCQAGH